jgi:hypothetical protein
MRDEAIRKGTAAGWQRRKGIRLRVEPGDKEFHNINFRRPNSALSLLRS